MKKLGLLLFPILAITLMLGGNAFAQGDNSVYFVTYYSFANTTGAPDGTLRIINDGDYASGPGGTTRGELNGTLWAAIYVFDDSQEMISCCACAISSDGLLSESVDKELTASTFTARAEIQRGVIKVLSSTSSDPTAPATYPGLRGWMTHIQPTKTTPPTAKAGPATGTTPWFVTEAALADSNLTPLEESNLGTVCSYAYTIASGPGACPCTLEDYDF
jgi:hypothetical protein